MEAPYAPSRMGTWLSWHTDGSQSTKVCCSATTCSGKDVVWFTCISVVTHLAESKGQRVTESMAYLYIYCNPFSREGQGLSERQETWTERQEKEGQRDDREKRLRERGTE